MSVTPAADHDDDHAAASAAYAEQLYPLLVTALDQARQPEAARAAEQQLARLEHEHPDGYLSALLTVVSAPPDSGAAAPARWLAAVCAKNALPRLWRRRVNDNLSERERSAVRRLTVACVARENERPTAAQLYALLSHEARLDYPHEWPELVPRTIAALDEASGAGDADRLLRWLRALNHIVKALASRRTPQGRAQFEAIANDLLSRVTTHWLSGMRRLGGGDGGGDASQAQRQIDIDVLRETFKAERRTLAYAVRSLDECRGARDFLDGLVLHWMPKLVQCAGARRRAPHALLSSSSTSTSTTTTAATNATLWSSTSAVSAAEPVSRGAPSSAHAPFSPPTHAAQLLYWAAKTWRACFQRRTAMRGVVDRYAEPMARLALQFLELDAGCTTGAALREVAQMYGGAGFRQVDHGAGGGVADAGRNGDGRYVNEKVSGGAGSNGLGNENGDDDDDDDNEEMRALDAKTAVMFMLFLRDLVHDTAEARAAPDAAADTADNANWSDDGAGTDNDAAATADYDDDTDSSTLSKRTAGTIAALLRPAAAQHLIRLLLGKYIAMSREELHAFDAEPEELARDTDDTEWDEDRPRAVAEQLVHALVSYDAAHTAPDLLQHTLELVHAGHLLLADAAYRAVGRCAFELHDYIDFHAWLHASLSDMLAAEPASLAQRVLQARGAVLIAQFVAHIALRDDRVLVHERVLALLQRARRRGDMSLGMAAVRALHALTGDLAFDESAFAACLAPTLEALFALIMGGGGARDVETKLRVLDVAALVVERCTAHTVQYAGELVPLLQQLWAAVACADEHAGSSGGSNDGAAESTGDLNMVRCQIASLVARLLTSCGPAILPDASSLSSPSSPLPSSSSSPAWQLVHLVLAIIAYATDPHGDTHAQVYLVEDALDLWQTFVRLAPAYYVGAHEAFPRVLAALGADTALDTLHSTLSLVESYALVGGDAWWRAYATPVGAALARIVSAQPRDRALLAVGDTISTLLQRFGDSADEGTDAKVATSSPVAATALAPCLELMRASLVANRESRVVRATYAVCVARAAHPRTPTDPHLIGAYLSTADGVYATVARKALALQCAAYIGGGGDCDNGEKATRVPNDEEYVRAVRVMFAGAAAFFADVLHELLDDDDGGGDDGGGGNNDDGGGGGDSTDGTHRRRLRAHETFEHAIARRGEDAAPSGAPPTASDEYNGEVPAEAAERARLAHIDPVARAALAPTVMRACAAAEAVSARAPDGVLAACRQLCERALH